VSGSAIPEGIPGRECVTKKPASKAERPSRLRRPDRPVLPWQNSQAKATIVPEFFNHQVNLINICG
jgi:hypothetical protein